MFIPGETITHEFRIPFASEDIKTIYVTYRQNDQIVLVKKVFPVDIHDVSGDLNFFQVTLEQNESLLFKNNATFYVQLNVLFNDSKTRAASVELKGTTGRQHYGKVVS